MPENSAVGLLMGMMPLVLILGVFYVIVILPQKKQQKQHEEMLKSLQKNDAVVTIGGIHGTIVNVKEHTISLRIDENIKIEIDRTAIQRKERNEQ